MFKKGDTLIEVLLAVGIFSMIAISVVAVMSGGTSSAQTALETTLAREEIDAQAEALRYIHDSYTNDRNSENPDLATVSLWEQIKHNAYQPKDDEEEIKEILQSTGSSCPTDTSQLPEGAFILDTRALNQSSAAAYKPLNNSDSSVYVPASTFPRLVFGNDKSLIESGTSTTLSRAEGIYVIAVADKDTTTIFDVDGNPIDNTNREPAFYDFYIRTCWYGTDNETPSTISTVIRLYNPDIQTQYFAFSAYLYRSKEDTDSIKPDKSYNSQPLNFGNYDPGTQSYYFFKGWCDDPISVGERCPSRTHSENEIFYNDDKTKSHYNFYATWEREKFTINFNKTLDSATGYMSPQEIDVGKTEKLDENGFRRTHYAFQGWSLTNGGPRVYQDRDNFKSETPGGTTLYAVWKRQSYVIKFNANGGSGTMTDQTIQIDKAESIKNVGFSRSYYTFKGWSLTPNGSVKYTNGQSLPANSPITGNDTITLYAVWAVNYYPVDVNPIINGTTHGSGLSGFTFNVYINGKLDASGVIDYYKQWPYGTTVRVVAAGKTGYSLSSGDTTQTVKGNTTFNPRWNINYYTVDVNPKINETSYPSGRTGYRFLVYVNGQSRGFFQDFYEQFPYGTTVRVLVIFSIPDFTPPSCWREWRYGLSSRYDYYYDYYYRDRYYDVTKTITSNTEFVPEWYCYRYY